MISEEIEQLRDELAQARAKIGQLCDRISNIASKRDDMEDKLTQTRTELMQIRKLWLNPAGAVGLRRQLKDLQGANHALMRQLADVTKYREYWYKVALKAGAERNKWREEAQAQSDEVQAHWLSPVVAEGLKRQLARMHGQLASIRKATDWLWGFWDGNTLVAKSGYEDDIREAWGRLLKATDSTDDAMQLQERLATLDAAEALLKDRQGSLDRACIELDAAEAALAGCGIGGIYAAFDGPADAIEQMAQHIKELTEEHDQIVNRVEDAMRQIEKYDKHLAENLIQYAVEDILERLVEAERESGQRQQQIDLMSGGENAERQLRQEAETSKRNMVRLLGSERQLRHVAEHELVMAEDLLRVVRQRAETAEAANRILWDQDTERAETLARLVTLELAALLKRLGYCILPYTFGDPHKLRQCVEDRKDARALAARIREALALEASDEG